jgi:hypothetical protein
MLHFSTLLLAFSVAGFVNAAPTQLYKRINQDTIAAAQPWEAACNQAGGGAQCNPIAVKAAATLLANAGPCDQQNSADAMMDLSKQLNSNQMIKLAEIFCQQPRNSPNSLSIPYCQQQPKNQELNGLFQCQFQGVNPTNFADGSKVGAPGTIPLGQNAPLNPAGSCPANPSGPIADGQQLVNLVQSPGVAGASGAGNSTAQSPSSAPLAASPSPTQPTPSPAAPAANTSPSPAAANSSASGFKAQNGKDAQALNQKFQALTPASPCTNGEQACVNGQFAQCVGGKFALTPCSGGTTCTALPLVNKAGTSVTCDSQADTTARINQALGSRAAASSGFKAQNGKDAQALNQKFQALTPASSCTSGEQACVNGQFAQCVGGKFALSPCSGGTTCTALPLVNKAGTSVTCDTPADTAARIAAALGSNN